MSKRLSPASREIDGKGGIVRAGAWGHAERHYAAPMNHALRPGYQSEDRASKLWGECLETASPGIRESVERTYKQWNTILRDYLRTETALRLTVGGEAQSVPVKVVGDMPRRFDEAMSQYEDLQWLLLNRPAVVDAVSGTRFMASHVDEVRRTWDDASGPSDLNEIKRVHATAVAWLRKLDEANAVERIIGIDEDVLGAYFFRVPEIRLYWVVIGIISRMLGVSAEALTIVVLAHELAHAYTHLGRDIDNERWRTEWFAAADIGIVEGLAQFYTHVICARLAPRMPAALAAYSTLLEKQSAPYKAHLEWVAGEERGGEIIRVSMIECRSNGVTETVKFADAVKRHRRGVRGRKEPGQGSLFS